MKGSARKCYIILYNYFRTARDFADLPVSETINEQGERDTMVTTQATYCILDFQCLTALLRRHGLVGT